MSQPIVSQALPRFDELVHFFSGLCVHEDLKRQRNTAEHLAVLHNTLTTPH